MVDESLAEARQKEKSGDLRSAFLICQSLLIDNYGDLPDHSLASLYEYMAQVSQLQGKPERADKYRRKAKSLRPLTTPVKETSTADSPGEPPPIKADLPAVSGPAPNSSIEKALSSVVESRAHEPIIEDETAVSTKKETDLEQVSALLEEEEPQKTPAPADSLDEQSAQKSSDDSPEILEAAAESDGRLIWVAGFWTRCAALTLDTLIVTCVVVAMILLSSVLLGDRATSGFLFFAQKISTLMLALLIYAFFLVAYLTLFARYGGQSAGKMVMGIRVVGLDGHAISTFQAIRRAIGMLLSAFVGLAGFFWTAFDLKRRGWHDYIGGTLVVYVHPKVKSVSSLP
ncbi:MAG: RDD family protein [Deltaproteobacteria bacterium]|nr:RDD family protein [Deltaproteobacteria bacterium]MBW1870897.1 RDD family protein [Deltaproteobacteria bacterium]